MQSYPQHEKAGQVQQWADQYDFELLDRQMHNRRRKDHQIEGAEEETFRDALLDEDKGKLADAGKKWKQLSTKKSSTDPELHAWGILGDWYAQELQKVEDRYIDLRRRVMFDKTQIKTTKADDELEQLAQDAVIAEEAEEYAKAYRKWDDLKKSAEASAERRHWYLLAAKRLYDLRNKQ